MNKVTEKSLNLIAERLSNGHASLFIGAGFSKNAILNHGAKLPPDWSELGDLFFEKIRGRKPKHGDRAYVNILRLAEEVECSLGREELSNIISDAIGDGNLCPSNLFYNVLSLPWKDIYTTNYDTLLERTSNYLKRKDQRSYSLVLSQQDLGNADSPLLIKLHGDINDPSSIVITEEDYRVYADSHGAMINHIRHTIMMETLVLIGVSGNDPNFIQWLGWVKDVLKDNQRKMYLLTVDSVSSSLRQIYERKNITIVNLRDLAGKNASPYDNITFAVDYIYEAIIRHKLQVNQYKNDALEWGKGASSRDEDINQTLKRWKNDFETYPGWLVLPCDRREYWNNIDTFSLSVEKLKKLKRGEDILYLNLFNWRLERGVLPIINDWESIYLSVLNKYNPCKCRADIKNAWINLKLSLLRLYRQESWNEKWQNLKRELAENYPLFTDEQKCRFAYELALSAVYRNNFELLEEILNDWPEQDKDPYWDIRRGALWAEYLSLNLGQKLVKKAFDKISLRLEELSCEQERFFWASRKVHAHTIWNCIKQANFSSDVKETEYARITWSELRLYDDIWYERQFFDSQIRDYDEVVKVKTKKPSFMLGRSSVTTKLDGNSGDYRLSYSYFLYYEELGFPIHLPHLSTIRKTTLSKALSIMAIASPSIAESFLLRSGDSKLVEAIFNRRFLNRSKKEEISQLYDKYVNLLSLVLDIDCGYNLPSWVLTLRSIIPEILSRLCLKSSYNSRVKTLELLERIYREKECFHYDGIDRLVESLMLSFSKEQIISLIPKFIGMPIVDCRYDDCRYDPLYYLKPICDKLPVIDTQLVDNLINEIGDNMNINRQIYYRLIFLYKCSALNISQQEKIAKFMWSKRDAFGFPDGTCFNRFAFLSLPHPKNVSPSDLFKDYIRQSALPKIGNNSSIPIYGGDVPLLRDIIGTSNFDIPFKWDNSLLNYVCKEIVLMWDCDKSKLLKEDSIFGFAVKDEVLMRFIAIEKIIALIMVPNVNLLSSGNIENLYRVAKEFENYGVPSFRSVTLLRDILGEQLDLDNEITRYMGDSDSRVVSNCISAVKQMYKNDKDVLKWVIIMSEYFRSNSEIAATALIDALDYFTQNEIFLLNANIQINVMIGLQRLFFTTEIEETDDELVANKKMNLRMMVAPLVKRMINLNTNMTDVLTSWTEYYESDETCLDIRNNY